MAARRALLGLAIALKLTPAVFLLYFVLRRDGRATLTAAASFILASLLGCGTGVAGLLEYWMHKSDRSTGSAPPL